jgi:hypothetical protein
MALADVQTAPMNVRFDGNNGPDADVTRCLLMMLWTAPALAASQCHRVAAL